MWCKKGRGMPVPSRGLAFPGIVVGSDDEEGDGMPAMESVLQGDPEVGEALVALMLERDGLREFGAPPFLSFPGPSRLRLGKAPHREGPCLLGALSCRSTLLPWQRSLGCRLRMARRGRLRSIRP